MTNLAADLRRIIAISEAGGHSKSPVSHAVLRLIIELLETHAHGHPRR